jgi:hypothetical protein
MSVLELCEQWENEAFVTSTAGGIMPVTRSSGRILLTRPEHLCLSSKAPTFASKVANRIAVLSSSDTTGSAIVLAGVASLDTAGSAIVLVVLASSAFCHGP